MIVEQPGAAASWSSRLFGGEATDADQVPLPATRTATGFVRPHAVGDQVSSVLDRLGMARGCWAVELQQEASAGGLLAPGWVPKAEVANLVQALGQDVLQEPAHELVAWDAAGPPPVGFAVLVTDGHRLVIEADDAGVGDSDAKHVAGEVVKHGLLAFTPGGAVDHLWLGPGGLGQHV